MKNVLSAMCWGVREHVPIVLVLLVATFALAAYKFYRSHYVRRVLASHASTRHFLLGYSKSRCLAKAFLFCTGVLLLGIALLRPQWGKVEEVVRQQGRDLFIALDISRSMCAQDCMPNRLACAKEKIKTLLSRLSCERVGLILFSGSSFMHCPLTEDYDAFKLFLDLIDVESISSGTTALDQAIKQVLDSYANMPERKNKLLVIFTDGEDFSSNLSGVKTEAARLGVHIFTVGVGSKEGAPIPLFDEHGKQTGHQKDQRGNVIISRLNQELLKNLAQEAGGVYVSASADAQDMQKIVDAVTAFETEKLADKPLHSLRDRYHYFLAAALVCLGLEWII